MKNPTKQQAAVFNWIKNGKGSLKLVARAGCGKTSTLMGSVEEIVNNNLGNIALMAYNKDIASELKARIAGLGIDWKVAQAGTCHSFGFSAWRYVAGDALVIEEKKVANIITARAATYPEGMVNVYAACAEAIEKLVGYAKASAFGILCDIDNMGEWYGLWDHFGVDSEVTEDWKAVDVIAAAIDVYNVSLSQCRQVIDFDDMILAPLYFRAKFWTKDWVMLDESQDVNPARRVLALKMMKPRTGRLILVGDDRQAIYGFTGADANSMDNIAKEVNAEMLGLSQTFRCAKAIIREAQRIVPDIEAHENNPEGVVRHMMSDKLHTQNLGVDDVILCRNTGPLISTAYELLSKGIPCRVEGREIGAGLVKLARRWKITDLSKLLEKLEDHLTKQTAKYKAKGQEEKIQGLEDQVECLKIVITRCQSKGKYTVNELVTEIQGMFGDTPAGEQPKVLTLSTIHKSKGREWVRVFVLGREKFMPSKYARKEWQQVQEANLEYVAITRAKMELVWVEMGSSPEEATADTPVAAPEAPQAVEAAPAVETPAPVAEVPAAPVSGLAKIFILTMEVKGGGTHIEAVSHDRLKLEDMADAYNKRDVQPTRDASGRTQPGKKIWNVEIHDII